MINRILIKNSILFDNIELEFNKNLIIFSGSSGSGKSVFMDTILSVFGYKEPKSEVVEVVVDDRLELEEYGVDSEDENILRMVSSKSTRYFINGSQLSKKNQLNVSKSFINYLNLREFSEFENRNLLNLLDLVAKKLSSNHEKNLNDYKKLYKEYQDVKRELERIDEEERKVVELKEFATFEIEKIESINPKVGEYEELMEQKKLLSKKEKIEEAIAKAGAIFELESSVVDALSLLERDSSFFSDAINTLQIELETAKDELSELDEVDIESLLDRLEALSSLKSRYGSIEEALNYLEDKKEELKRYENIEFEKGELLKRSKELISELDTLGAKLTKHRKEAIEDINKEIKEYCKKLFLEDIVFSIKDDEISESGFDRVEVNLAKTTLNKVSSGELNRIRLAYLSVSSSYRQSGGVLILDEIDANLSGKESMSVAKVLKELSSVYQIFAISHQPQLSSFGDEHFLVYKESGKSFVKRLEDNSRVEELSRMISGDEITNEAKEFAKKMLEEAKLS